MEARFNRYTEFQEKLEENVGGKFGILQYFILEKMTQIIRNLSLAIPFLVEFFLFT